MKIQTLDLRRPARGQVRSALFLLLCCIVYLLTPASARAATRYVDGTLASNCSAGNYSIAARNCTGSDGIAYVTFVSAVAAVQPGDTVAIRGGTYRSQLYINRSGTPAAHIRFMAYQSEVVIIDLAGFSGSPSGIDVTNQHHLDIEGLAVFNAPGYGFRSTSASDITLSDSEIAYSRNGGAVFEYSSNVSVARSSIHHNNNGGTTHEGLTMWVVDQFSVTDSEIYENNKEGFVAKYGARHGTIARNHFYRNNGPNLYLDAASDIKVYGNVCHEPRSSSKTCIMISTETGSNPNHYQSTDLTIYNNVLYGSTAGISFWLEADSNSWARFDRIRIEYNTFVDNNVTNWGGLFIIAGTPANFGTGNTIRNNIFIGNGGRGIRDDVGVINSFAVDHNLFRTGEQNATLGASPVVTSADPFIDRAGRDYRLTINAPARSAGVAIADITTDFAGNPRPTGATDIGAYQYADPAGGNHPPVARVTADVTAGLAPLTVHFDGSTSSDPDAGDTITYSWDLNGDGTFGDATGSGATFTYTTIGSFTATLRVTDPDGLTGEAPIVITTAGDSPPAPSITSPGSSALYRVGDTITFAGQAIDPDTNQAMPASTFQWRVLLNYCAVSNPSDCHENLVQQFTGVAGGTVVAPDHEYPAFLRFELTATKPAVGSQPALSTTVSRHLQPETSSLTLDTVPSGLSLSLYGSAVTTPVSRTIIVNSRPTIGAPSPQTLGGTAYVFTFWSDAGAQTHTITATAAPMSLTAIYTNSSTASFWNSWDVVTQAGSPQGQVTAATGITAAIEFYESTNNGGVVKGSLFGTFSAGVHTGTFNNVEKYWGPAAGNVYPYAGKSTVNRGADAGETNAQAPLDVRDLQLHPPNNLHQVVAAFRVPVSGSYTISNLGVRRVSNLGGPVGLHVFDAQQVEIAALSATTNRAWVVSPNTYTLSGLTAGTYIYFAVDRSGDYSYDATEIAWTVMSNASAAPPAPSCTLTATPSSITQGATTSLAWTTANATELSIDNGVGTVTPTAGGSVNLTPAATTQYTATATGAGGTATCSATVTVTTSTSPSVWNSWEVVTQSGSPQGQVIAATSGVTAAIEFYESTNNGGVAKGSLLSTFTVGPHAGGFNNLERYWAPGTGNVYPYAGKSTVNRGSDAGETNAQAPLGVRDLQLHPPNNLHHIVAAFRVPVSGSYTISNLGVRRVSNLGGPVGLHVFDAQQVEIAALSATTNRAWVVSPNTYTLSGLTAGTYIYFAVDRSGDYSYDATEITWTVMSDASAAPPAPSCTLTATPSSITQGATTSLAWTTANATELSIDNGVGTVTPTAGGSVNLTPAATTRYTATATGAGGTATCSATVTVTTSTSPSVWNSWEVVTQAGSPQAVVTAAATGTAANVEFYESTNNGGVVKGALLSGFTAGAHPQAFNNVQQYWGPGTGSVYPYAGKSTVNRGADAGETNAQAPLGVRDLQLHPPNNLHYTVAAFKVPTAGTYTIANLGVRRVYNLGGPVGFHVLNAQQVEIAALSATNNRAWTVNTNTYTLPNLVAGSYVYFAVDRAGDYNYDATEIAWTITRTGP